MEDDTVFGGTTFSKLLELEHRRIERTSRGFILSLIEVPDSLRSNSAVMAKAFRAISELTRETDIKGWYKEHSVFGIIFTEIEPSQGRAVVDVLTTKISNALRTVFTTDQMVRVRLSCFVFPEDLDKRDPDGDSGRREHRRIATMAKRCIDIAGSVSTLLLLTPVLAVIAVAIKATSKGPVLFRQGRQGQYGRPFIFLKFRSMHEHSDSTVHEEFMKRLILGDPGLLKPASGGNAIYKLTNDKRITTVGRFLRRTSLDELPQLLNVLKGEMSLVGPRPPIAYEVARYATWHKRRLRETKPGITGLWQVRGRSRTTFDEMVRLDLQYGRTWSIWLDIKLLIQTPWAVLMGIGAY